MLQHTKSLLDSYLRSVCYVCKFPGIETHYIANPSITYPTFSLSLIYLYNYKYSIVVREAFGNKGLKAFARPANDSKPCNTLTPSKPFAYLLP